MIYKKNILGVDISDATKKEILEYVIKSLENFDKKYYIVTPNPEILVLANKNLTFKKVLNSAKIALNDGIGVHVAAKILGKPLKERVTGIDLLESLCEEVVKSNAASAENPITVGFLGSGVGVAEKTAECLQARYPNLKISFVGQEWSPNGFRITRQVESGIKNHESGMDKDHNSSFIIHNSIDVLFVAFGAPKQEIWISENLDKIPVKVAIGVGGAFDYISGRIPRAPFILQKLGLEWLFRLIIQPWRIKRQLALLKFIRLVLKEKLIH